MISVGRVTANGPSNSPSIDGESNGRGRTAEVDGLNVRSSVAMGVPVLDASTSTSWSAGFSSNEGLSLDAEARSSAVSLFRFLVSAAFLAASFLCMAFAGSRRPSVSQSGSGRLNNADLSDAASPERLDDLVETDPAMLIFVCSLAVELDLGGISVVL